MINIEILSQEGHLNDLFVFLIFLLFILFFLGSGGNQALEFDGLDLDLLHYAETPSG